jgi:hypothetical protein
MDRGRIARDDVNSMLRALSVHSLATNSPRAALLVIAAAHGDTELEEALDGVVIEGPPQGSGNHGDLRGRISVLCGLRYPVGANGRGRDLGPGCHVSGATMFGVT